MLKKVFNYFQNGQQKVDDVYLVCCQHLLEPQLRMFEMFIDYGFEPQKIFVLGKAYSANSDILKELQERRINVIQPKFSGIAFDDEHKNNCRIITNLIPNEARTIIIDDGAELIKTFAELDKKVLFAVEQTSSGFRKLENDQPLFPVINVARSATKLVQESPLIARLCFERINTYLSNKDIKNPNIIVVGLGPIGEAILQIFKQNSFNTSGFDVKNGHSNLPAFINEMKADVVIGATGFPVLLKEDIDNLVSEKPLYLISVSSSDREFPVAFFRSGNEIHQDINFKNITFVNNGFPITFKGNRNELTPVEIEKTICLLGGAVIFGVTKGIEKSGLVDVSEDLEKLIN